MDAAIETVLREYDQRAEAEMKRMQALPPAEMMQHIDEFLLPVGPATGQLMNILIRRRRRKLSSRSEPRTDTRRYGWPRRLVRPGVKSSRSMSTPASRNTLAMRSARPGLRILWSSSWETRANRSRRSPDRSISYCSIYGKISTSRASTFSIRSWDRAR